MVNFCPECSNLLRKKLMDGKRYMVCKCGYRKESDNNERERILKEINKKKEALNNNLIIVSDKEKILVHPKTSKICPKCGHKKAVYWQEQLFSADEPMVSFFRCLKCNGIWREY